jgi:hypothetical protein
MGALLSKKLSVCLSTIAILTSVVGCGDDERSPTPSNTAGSGGSGGSGATGGSGGTGGGTGGTGGGTVDAGPDPDSGTIVCGTSTCTSLPFITACCTAANTCGITIGSMCIEPMPGGRRSARCARSLLWHAADLCGRRARRLLSTEQYVRLFVASSPVRRMLVTRSAQYAAGHHAARRWPSQLRVSSDGPVAWRGNDGSRQR